MSSEVYQETGNKIPVTEDELLKVMNQKYTDYYNDNSLPNPDKTDVIYTTKDGKTIKIPDEIKIKAKTLWVKALMESKTEEIKKNKNEDTNKKSTSTNWGNMLVLLIVIIIALYLLYILSQKK